MADNVLMYKYIIKNVARSTARPPRSCPSRCSATTARGMHVHMSLWKDGTTLFAGNGYAGPVARWRLYAIGGLLKHAPALCAFTNPTTNSYKRLVPGYEAPVNLAYSQPQPLGGDPHPDVLRRARRPSGSSSAARTRRATRTWRSPRC